ncbi:MAG: TerC/Alx family metal homeostasis membrane protein [Bacteroidales bacterium]|nr:TerC/Alx family metal homeostasis membrane protein [Bacteroidales bacterium]
MHEIFVLLAFLAFICIALAMDLGLFNKTAHKISLKESLVFTCVWIGIAVLFFVLLRFFGDVLHGVTDMESLKAINIRNGHNIDFKDGADFAANLQLYRNQLSLEFITGYLIEYAMSIDNVFVILLIFTGFGVDEKYYHRVLFWGILGAIVMRFIFIFALSELVHKFAWILAVFGAILIVTAVRMFLNRNKQEKVDVENHKVVKLVSKYFAVSPRFHEERFFIKENGKHLITPLFLVLLVIEFSDVIFAVDSVPAIFSVTKDQYIVFISNIFAIIGLRSLFFLLSSIVNLFYYLRHGLSILLGFIGVKMMLEVFDIVHINTIVSLSVILVILVGCILLSVLFPPESNRQKTENESIIK